MSVASVAIAHEVIFLAPFNQRRGMGSTNYQIRRSKPGNVALHRHHIDPVVPSSVSQQV